MRTVKLPGDEVLPALGQGTWHMGENASERPAEVAALRAGLDLGLALIDTAEMYGEGGAEEVVGKAIAGRRDGVFIVSKVFPHNATSEGAIAACDRSLKRLGTDRIDLYLLHWRGSVPLAETVAAFEQLKRAGKIRHWGVSNFDVADLDDLRSVPKGANCAANQVLYNLDDRGVDWQLLDECERRGMIVMAYSPLAQGRILSNKALLSVAGKHGVSAAVIATAWTLRRPNVVSIPKTARADRMAELARAADFLLDAEDLAALDLAFAPPSEATPLAIL